MQFKRLAHDPLSRRPAVLAVAVVIAVGCSDKEPTAAALPTSTSDVPSYSPPSLEGFTLSSEEDRDGDGDGVNETHVRRYRNARGDSLFTMTTSGVLWAWSLDTHADDDAVGNNYVIRDSDCDGVFDERYTLDDEFQVPECVKR